MKLTREQECEIAEAIRVYGGESTRTPIGALATCMHTIESVLAQNAQTEAQPAPDAVEQQVTAILQETVKETNELWVAAAEKVARVREEK